MGGLTDFQSFNFLNNEHLIAVYKQKLLNYIPSLKIKSDLFHSIFLGSTENN